MITRRHTFAAVAAAASLVMTACAGGGSSDTEAKEFTAAGRATKDRVEARTDELAAPAYDVLSAAEVDELASLLEPLKAAVDAAEL